MPCLPKIDQPCPLGISERRRLAGFCTHCETRVHSLDAMSDRDRRAFLQRATGPVCVSYRLPAGLGAVLALSLAGPAMANEPAATAFELSNGPTQSILAGKNATAPTSAVSTLAAEDEPPECDDSLEHIEFLGGISKPGEAEWIDLDASLPELPMTRVVSEPADGAPE
jgi:hypothetical protein